MLLHISLVYMRSLKQQLLKKDEGNTWSSLYYTKWVKHQGYQSVQLEIINQFYLLLVWIKVTAGALERQKLTNYRKSVLQVVAAGHCSPLIPPVLLFTSVLVTASSMGEYLQPSKVANSSAPPRQPILCVTTGQFVWSRWRK